ncbi:MAG: pyruvate:ferredoxin (flavodoxin) oxidoreductase, partial [Cellulosilyticaceae bacterium]
LKKGGSFVLNTEWTTEELADKLPAKLKKYIADKEINFYTVNATSIAKEIGLGTRINMIMQAAFFKLAAIIPAEEAKEYLKTSIKKAYGKKGDKIVNMNYEAVEQGMNAIVKVEVPANWAEAKTCGACTCGQNTEEPEFITNIVKPINAQEGDSLPVSAFNGREDGTFPAGTAAYEKRGIAVDIPEWDIKNCIQCNQCAYVCPHACIRPVLITEEEKASAPETFESKKAIGKAFAGLEYRMQISPLDCTGCANCVDICPAKEKALVMKPLATQVEAESANWDYAVKEVSYKGDLTEGKTVKDSQFKTPLIEFSGACAGCGETPYIKLVTQLFGDRMMIANATGCSSIWGGSAPSTPYTTNHKGQGPSWANSLFEDNAEYGYGMFLAVKQMRNKVEECMKELVAMDIADEYKAAFENWLTNKENGEASKLATAAVEEVLENNTITDEAAKAVLAELEARKDYLVKRSQWILGGDGWAYDIGYGGLDHVLASGENVNVLVFDTEIYSNTGGQSSKSTPTAAIAKFAASGKRSGKKNLGTMMMQYGNVYVAQVAMGADKNQLIKALLEAENYDGPSIVIAYAPCISHGLKKGMGCSINNMDEAVKAGYWHLYRYNPMLTEEGKNPFSLDSKEPTGSFREFIMDQVRYSALAKQFPEQSEVLFVQAEEDAKRRLAMYKALAAQQ